MLKYLGAALILWRIRYIFIHICFWFNTLFVYQLKVFMYYRKLEFCIQRIWPSFAVWFLFLLSSVSLKPIPFQKKKKKYKATIFFSALVSVNLLAIPSKLYV